MGLRDLALIKVHFSGLGKVGKDEVKGQICLLYRRMQCLDSFSGDYIFSYLPPLLPSRPVFIVYFLYNKGTFSAMAVIWSAEKIGKYPVFRLGRKDGILI